MSVADDTADAEIDAEPPVTVHWQAEGVTAYLDECLRVLRTLPANSIHAVVTDPPYGLEFMGAEWDKFGGGEPKPAGARIRKQSGRDAEPGAAHNGSTFMVARNVPESYSTGAGQRAKPGIGDRPTEWPSNQGWNGFRCRNCHHLAHGGSPCTCDNPDFARADGRWNAYQAWCEAWAAECYRVMIPGAWLVAFGGPRTVHRLTCGIEDAGFEIKDLVPWLFGQGFPKSKNAGRAIDMLYCGQPGRHYETQLPKDARPDDHVCPEHPEGDPWREWGTAFKPANEPIVIARKPLTGTLARNLLEHGTGALNIGAGRVPHAGPADLAESEGKNRHADFGSGPRDNKIYGADGRDRADQGNYDGADGRWPPNVIFSHSAECEPIGTRVVRPSAHGTDRGNGVSSGYHGDIPRAHVGAGRPETVEAWDCVTAQTIQVERFTLPDGTTVEPATAAAPVLLGVLEAVRDLLPSASRTAGTRNTPGSERARELPVSGPADSPGDCHPGRRSGDVPLHEAAEAVRSSFQQLAGALESVLALGHSLRHSPDRQSCGHQSSSDDARASNTPEHTAPCKTASGDQYDLSASAGTTLSTADTGSLAQLPAELGDSTLACNTRASGDSAAPTPFCIACTDAGFRHQASSVLRAASEISVVAYSHCTLTLPGCPVAELDAQSGVSTSSSDPDRFRGTRKFTGATYAADSYSLTMESGPAAVYADTGGASRFFHTLAADDGDHPLPPFMWNPKASTAERPRLEDGTGHSTVKPLALMRLIVRLVTPPDGTVLDLFGGSGTTGEACIIEGFPVILIEQLPVHMRMIIKRLSKAIQPVLG